MEQKNSFIKVGDCYKILATSVVLFASTRLFSVIDCTKKNDIILVLETNVENKDIIKILIGDKIGFRQAKFFNKNDCKEIIC